MKRRLLLMGALVCVLSVSMMGCDAGTTGSADASGDTGTAASADDFDPTEAYWGQWRGSVKIEGQTVYGTAGGSEQMLDVNLNEDGTCTVEPLESHADLLTDEGTWEGTESEITLHLSGGDIVLTVVDSSSLEGNAADFDIADFDTINFAFYG